MRILTNREGIATFRLPRIEQILDFVDGVDIRTGKTQSAARVSLIFPEEQRPDSCRYRCQVTFPVPDEWIVDDGEE